MPTPVYIICSESGAIDKRTNAISIFDVLEKIVFAEVSSPEEMKALPGIPSRWIHIRMMAVWRRTDQEAGVTFEHQTVFTLPGDETERVISEGSFVFKSSQHRFIHNFGGPPINKEGVVRVENRIRPVGEDDWHIQVYEIAVERLTVKASRQSPTE